MHECFVNNENYSFVFIIYKGETVKNNKTIPIKQSQKANS